MASGNFLIGDNLSVEGFNKYIIPSLKMYDIKVSDVLYKKLASKGILISLVRDVGEKTSLLEEFVQKSMEEAYSEVNKDFEKHPSKCLVYPHQICNGGNWAWNIIGVYSDDKTASKLFPSLALDYFAEVLTNRLENIEESMSDFAEKFEVFK